LSVAVAVEAVLQLVVVLVTAVVVLVEWQQQQCFSQWAHTK
jgi:hypothetical protein